MTYVCCIPVRYSMAIMLFFGTLVSTILRLNINVIITVLLPKNDTKWDGNMICTRYNSSNKLKYLVDKYYFSNDDETLVMSSFYWGYCLSGLVAGYVAEQWGPTRVTAISTMSSAIMTLLVPIAYQKSMVNIAALRLVVGLGEGVILNCSKKLIISWSPVQERKYFCYILYGSIIGTVMSYPLFGLIVYYQQWEIISYFVGAFSFIWALFFLIFGGDDPATYKHISVAEREYIESNQLQNVSFYSRRRRRKIPWRFFIKSECVLALQILLFTNSWNLFFFTDYLPLYINRAIGMSPTKSACFAAVPILCRGLISFPSVWLAKRLISKNCMSVTTTRKLFTFFSHILPGILLQVLSAHPTLYTSSIINMAFITMAMAMNGNIVSGGVVNTMDITPHLAGSLYTILYNISNLSGMIMPFTIVGFISDQRSTTCGWNHVLAFQSSMYLFGGVVFLCMGSGLEQPWDAEYVKQKTNPNATINVVPEGVSSFYHKMDSPQGSTGSPSIVSKYSYGGKR